MLRFRMPGMPHAHVRYSAPPYSLYQPWPMDHSLYVPTATEMAAIERDDNRHVSQSGRFHYVKLHGSLNWWSKRTKEIDKEVMVIGGKKEEQIADEPLLQWYWKLFKRALYGENRRLWIIGYGFGDTHVNEVIARAIRDFRLRWFSITPSSTVAFSEELGSKPYGDVLLEGHSQHFVGSLSAIYPAGGRETRIGRRIDEALKR
jgi:hypothetical protein